MHRYGSQRRLCSAQSIISLRITQVSKSLIQNENETIFIFQRQFIEKLVLKALCFLIRKVLTVTVSSFPNCLELKH